MNAGRFSGLQAQRLPVEVEEWGTTTTIGILAGMMYGGLRAAASPSPVRSKHHLSCTMLFRHSVAEGVLLLPSKFHLALT